LWTYGRKPRFLRCNSAESLPVLRRSATTSASFISEYSAANVSSIGLGIRNMAENAFARFSRDEGAQGPEATAQGEQARKLLNRRRSSLLQHKIRKFAHALKEGGADRFQRQQLVSPLMVENRLRGHSCGRRGAPRKARTLSLAKKENIREYSSLGSAAPPAAPKGIARLSTPRAVCSHGITRPSCVQTTPKRAANTMSPRWDRIDCVPAPRGPNAPTKATPRVRRNDRRPGRRSVQLGLRKVLCCLFRRKKTSTRTPPHVAPFYPARFQPFFSDAVRYLAPVNRVAVPKVFTVRAGTIGFAVIKVIAFVPNQLAIP